MTRISEPEVTLNVTSAGSLLGNTEQRVLMVGQMLSTGVAVSGVVIELFPEDGSEDTLFGARSILANQVKAFRELNKETRLDVLPIVDAAGTAAGGTFGFTGTATAVGQYTVIVGSGETGSVILPVAIGDTAAALATALAALLTALPNLPVTAVATIGDCDITAANLGTIGNTYGLSVDGQVAGITIAVTAMVNGATDPTTTALLDVVDEERYQTFIWADYFDLTVIGDFLDARFNVNNDILDGVAISTVTDTFTNLFALGNTFNSQSMVILGNNVESEANAGLAYEGPAQLEFDAVQASIAAALRSLRLTDGANTTSILSGAVGADARGGAALASRPYFNTPAANLAIIRSPFGFTTSEVGQLKNAGISTVGNDRPRTSIIFGEFVTTYKTDSAGNPDPVFKFLNAVDTSVNIRESFFVNFKAEYPQMRLTDEDLVEGRPMQNEASIRSFLTLVYVELAEIALTRAGSNNIQVFKSNTVITINLESGLATILFNKVPIVGQLRGITATLAISLAI